MTEDARPLQILLVDDDRDIRETLGEMLSEEGFVVEASWNGETALARLREGLHPDVILLDIMMPAMDGLTFRSFQRKEPALADIPVVGLTAFAPADADFECLRKPVAFDDLVATLRRAAGRTG